MKKLKTSFLIVLFGYLVVQTTLRNDDNQLSFFAHVAFVSFCLFSVLAILLDQRSKLLSMYKSIRKHFIDWIGHIFNLVSYVSESKIFSTRLGSIGILLALSTIIYYKWLSFSIFISGDYHWIPAETLAYLKPLSAWRSFLTTGEPNWVLWSGYNTSFFGLFGSWGFDSNVAMNIFILWFLVIMGPILSFIFVRKYTDSNFTATVFSLLLLFNSYILTNITVGHLFLSVAFYIGLLALYFYATYLESHLHKVWALVAATLTLWFTGIIDFRIFYLLFICFMFYQLFYILLEKFKFNPLRLIYHNFLFFILLFLLNANWILPTAFIQEANDILLRPIFGKGLIDLFNSWSGTYYYWSISNKIVWGVDTGFPMIFMLLPLAVMVALYYSKKNTNIIVFSFIFIIAAFFGKQNTAPFARFYEFLYAYFPGFSAFRDASKIFQLAILAMPVVLAIGFDKTKERIPRTIIFLITLLVVVLNIFSLVMYQNHMFVTAQIPDYYEDVFNLQSNKFERIIWVPRHETIRTGTTTNPRLTLLEMKDTAWFHLFKKLDDPSNTNQVLQYPFLRELFAMSSVKYVVVPKQIQKVDMLINDDAFYYSDDRDQMISIIDSLAWLNKLTIHSADASIYEVNSSRPHLYLTQELETFTNMFDLDATTVEYDFINPSVYRLHLKNISDASYLTFTDSYSQQWMLGPNFTNYIDFSRWSDEIIVKNKRFKNQAGGNVFLLDKDFITSITDDYSENADGSVDATVTLYYSPQKMLVIGNLITGITLMVVLLYFLTLIYLSKINKKRHA